GYHAAVVVVVELPASVLPYYWVTVSDRHVPFTVAVEHTRLVGTDDYGDRVIVYLGRYASPEDAVLQLSDEQVRARFLDAAAAAFHPGFATPLAAHVFRAPAAQPIIRPGWATQRPPLETGVTGLYAANMAQIYPWDRGVNYSLALRAAFMFVQDGAVHDMTSYRIVGEQLRHGVDAFVPPALDRQNYPPLMVWWSALVATLAPGGGHLFAMLEKSLFCAGDAAVA